MLSEQQQRIMGYFIEEAKDHLNTIEQGLLNLQATIADPEMVNELFRAAHSVKGGAAMLGLTSIQNTSHRLEDYFKVLKECPIKIDQKLETLLLRVYDTLQELLEQLQGPFGLTDDKAEEAMAAVEPTFAELNLHLSQLVSQAGVQTPEDVDLAVAAEIPAAVSSPAPARATTEESALRFIFQNDVPARLREMLQLFKQADTPETRRQLQGLCQTLAQPGEQLDLLDWCQLLDTTERAILNPDNTYRTLAPVVIKEIKRAQEQILSNNSAQITASADLLALVPPEPFSEEEITDTSADLFAAVDETVELDLFAEAAVASNDMVSGDLLSDDLASDEAEFLSITGSSIEDTNQLDEPIFDALTLNPNDSDNALDLSFIDQFDESIPALSNNQTGPEVGVAELNSLADLFEGEEPDLGLAWQEEIVGESGGSEPESLDFDEPSGDFSDLLFQDSEALVDEIEEEDLSGLLNNSAQKATAEPADADIFTFGDAPIEANLTSLDQELDFADLEPSETGLNTGLDFEAALFSEEPSASSELGGLDMLFSEESTDSSQPDQQGSTEFDALFGEESAGDAELPLGDNSAADSFDFDAELGNAELAADMGALDDDLLADDAFSAEMGLNSESDLLDLSGLESSDLELSNLESDLALSDLEMPQDHQAQVDSIAEALDFEAMSLDSAQAESTEQSLEDELFFDAAAPLDDATASLASAEPGVWQPETVLDPWNESEDAQSDLLGLDAELAESDLFSLDADLGLSEPTPEADSLDSELELAETDLFIESLNGTEPSNAEMDFQALDDSTLEVLNQPSLELTPDEAANLDFNFDEAFDSSLNPSEPDSPEAGSAFELLSEEASEDAGTLDLNFDELEPVQSTQPEIDETPFHFGALADSPADNASPVAGLDDLTNGFDASDQELDLFGQSEAEPTFAVPVSDLDADANFNEVFNFADDSTSDEGAVVDLSSDLFNPEPNAELDVVSDLFATEEVIEINPEFSDENADIDALLLTELSADAVMAEGLNDLNNLDELNLDEFALPDDFSDTDSTIVHQFGTDEDLEEMVQADSTVEAAVPEAEFDAGLEASLAEVTVEEVTVESTEPQTTNENPFEARSLADLFEADEVEPSVTTSSDFDLEQFELEPDAETHLFEVMPAQVEGAALDLDQSVDMSLFDPESSSEFSFETELPISSGSDELPEAAEASSFDLFATESVDSETLASEASGFDLFTEASTGSETLASEDNSFDLFRTETLDSETQTSEAPNLETSFETDWADQLNLDAESTSDTTEPDLSLDAFDADLNFEDLTIAGSEAPEDANPDVTTEQLLDAAFSVEGIEDENLLEFAPDARTDSAPEDELTEGFDLFADTTALEPTTEPGLSIDELSFDASSGETSNEFGNNLPTDDLSLDFESAFSEQELTETDVSGIDTSGASDETADLGFDFSGLEAAPAGELDFDSDDLSDDLSANLNDETSRDTADFNFDQVFGDVSSPSETEEATLEFDFSSDLETSADLESDRVDAMEMEPLMLEPSEEASLDLTTDLERSDSDLDLDALDFDSIDFGTDLTGDLAEPEASLDLGELDAVDLGLDAESTPSNLIAEGDLNDLDLDGLLEESSLPSEATLLDTLDTDDLGAEFSEAPEVSEGFDSLSFDSLSDDGELDDLEAMLAEGGSVELGSVSAEPAGFDDLAAMLADEPMPITAIHVEEEEIAVQAASTPDQEAFSQADDDDFADLEALLDDEPFAAAPAVSLPQTEPMPISSPPMELEDEFSDLEALLQDADQSLGVGSSPTRKVSTTTNRRPGRRGGLNEQTMRVSVKHLDNLNNLVGEMVVNRNSLEQAEERLRQFLDNLLYQVQQLSDVGQRMRDLYERSLLESSLLSGRRGSMGGPISGFSSGGQSNHAAGMSFDALEMDRFTGFHVLSQEMIELIVRVRESASDIDFVVEETDQVTRNFRQITTQLQEGLTRSRMVPFSQTADRLPRGVRDNSLKYGKQAELIIEGRDTLIDKMIVEQLYDPMTHLVNNAIAHGIETPEERIAAGKSPTGQIVIRTFHQGNQTVISVSDDGAGINPEKVRAKALAKGLINEAQAREMTRLDTYDLLFHHGFSTVDHIDDLRGRGVGLDVVRNNLNEIRGTISIDSTVGKGTTFTIRLPLTLSISKALCCISHRARIAFPMDGVEDMLDVPKERIQTDEQGRPCIQWRDMTLPFQPLSDLLRYNRILGRGSVYGGNQEEDVISIVVLRSAGNFLALQVDQVLGEQEIVIKQLEGPVPKPLGVAGATVLGDGRIMPIADVLELIDLWQGRIRRESGGLLWDKGEAQLPPEPAKTESTVLIVDDSITVRELLSMTFNKVGYRVEQARDGQEAWEKLRSGLPCDLVFCDIEMPRMDGLELLSRIQKDSNLSHLPIAMLTSRGADRHRQMAVQLGAKGYFTKPYLEEVLLDAAQRMLKGEVMIPGVNTQ